MEESLQNHSNILDTNSTVTGVTIDPDRLSAVCVSPSATFTFVPMFSLHTCSFSALLFVLCAKIVTCFHVFWKLDNAFTYGPNFQVVSRFTVWIKQQTLWQTVSREEGVTLETALHTHMFLQAGAADTSGVPRVLLFTLSNSSCDQPWF